MSKDTITMINNLESKVIDHIDNIIKDQLYDPSNLIEDYKAVYNEIKKEVPSEQNINYIDYNIDNTLMNDLIVQSMISKGDDSLNELSPDIAKKYYYQKEIIKNVRNKQLESLKEFILEYKLDTVLVYHYHELYILQKIMDKKHMDVVPYIREHFVEDSKIDNALKLSYKLYSNNLRKLLTFLIIPKKTARFYSNASNATILQLKHDFSDKFGMANFACLDILFNGGTESIEQLLKIMNVDASQFGDCLPIDLNIKTRYHSIFICPIMKCFCGDENPPMRLSCGHVISQEAVDRLSKNKGSLSFKCPYCPNDCRLTDIKRLYL